MVRDRLGFELRRRGHRLRLLRLRAQALLADRHRLHLPHRQRRRGRRRPEHRCRGLRHLQRQRRLERGRRHQRLLPDDRRDVRAGGQRRQQPGRGHLPAHRQPVPGHQRRRRQLQPDLPVHRRQRLQRPDRQRHPNGLAAFGGGSTTGNTVTVTNPGSQSGKVGTAVSLQISGSDSASGQTLTYSATGLPAGLSISSSGLISGTPTTAATSSVTVTAKDTTGATGSTTFSWTVSAATGNTVTVTSPGNQTGTVGKAVSLQISGSDSASGQTLTYSATGLPAGLSISSSGLISGTPTTAATSSVTVTAKDTTGATGSTTFSWTVSSSSSCASPGNKVANGTFASGATSWTSSPRHR
ncbi:hypothetical protein GXW82_15785 [Streptacidiphilus sp. 4-A2]|nr:hypothetical protein [Streptacidiphilus sp. 4-A2]